MPRVMAEQGELIVSLFWSWLAGAIYVRKITDGETDRQAYSDKLIQTAFIHWPLLWCVPHLLVLIYRRQLQCGTVPNWETEIPSHAKWTRFGWRTGKTEGEEEDGSKSVKKYPSVWRASYRLRWNFQICILPLDVLIWFDLFPFFPNLIAIKCRLFFSSSWTFCFGGASGGF